MFEEAKGEWKDNEWQSNKEKWHGNEQWQAKHEKQQQKKGQGKKQWQSNLHWDWAATAAAKAKMNAAPINWDNPIFDLAYKMADFWPDIGSLEDDIAEVHRTLHIDFHNNNEKIKAILADGMKQVEDVKQELRYAIPSPQEANDIILKLIGLADELSNLKAERTSDEPAWKKARVE